MGDARSGELGALPRPDGGVSTEISITVTDPRLNGGRPTNIPLLVHGQVDVDTLLAGGQATGKQFEIAIQRAAERVQAGESLPAFESIEQAVQAAQQRSQEGGSLPKFGTPQRMPLAPSTPRESVPEMRDRLQMQQQIQRHMQPRGGAQIAPGLRPLRDVLRETMAGPTMTAQARPGMVRNLPGTLHDAAPIHEQVEPDFLDFERGAAETADRPNEPVTPRERDSLQEIDRIQQMIDVAPDTRREWTRGSRIG